MNPTIAKRRSIHDGFSLLELIVVIAGLGILASLAIPNFLKYLDFAQIDEAKSLLNAAASECLQKFRQSPQDDYSWENLKPEVLESRKSSTEGGKDALPGPYTYQDEKETCKEVEIFDPAGGDTVFPTFRFRIDRSGKVYKESQFFNDESRQACETWGNCGGSESADYLIECKTQQVACEQAYKDFPKTQANGGPKEIGKWRGACKWPRDPEASCPLIQVWTFDGKIVTSKAEYDELFDAKVGAECAKSKNDKIASLSPPGEGIIDIPECEIYERYLSGSPLNCTDASSCEIAYLAAKEAKRKENCDAALTNWIEAGVDGKFSESGCEAKWQCNKVILTSQADYDASPCGVTCTKTIQPVYDPCAKQDKRGRCTGEYVNKEVESCSK